MLLFALLGAAISGRAAPIVISGGFELLTTPAVTLNTLYGPHAAYSSTPIPLGSYDFGTGAGPINTGDTDFLLTRINSITLPGIGSTASVPILQLAFNNRTDQVVPYSGFGMGVTGSGHVTASVSPNYTSLGSETIVRTSDTGGTFTLTYNNEIAFYAEDGTLLSNSPVLSITSLNGTWQSTPPTGALVIPGVNDYNFYVDSVTLANSIGNTLTLTDATPSTTPEPGSTILTALGVLPLSVLYIRRRRS